MMQYMFKHTTTPRIISLSPDWGLTDLNCGESVIVLLRVDSVLIRPLTQFHPVRLFGSVVDVHVVYSLTSEAGTIS